MPLWMNACDLFAFPSISESFGVVQVEAMACGRPVVATCNGGSEEIVNDPGVGMLVPPGDATALAGAIRDALERRWDSRVIEGHAERYRWDRIVVRILDEYRSLVTSGRSPAT